MTDQEINKAIADACGWRKEDGVYLWSANGIDCTCPELWDWCNDLNSMYAAEKYLFEKSKDNRYGYELAIGECATMWHATARERAEAFLRTLDKWEEAECTTNLGL